MLLDENYNLKIIDFGFAAPVMGRDGKGSLYTDLGTPGYMAPEIRDEKEYKGHEVDLFAVGVILFIMYTGHPPFDQAHTKDPHFKYIFQERADIFWKAHQQVHPKGFFSDEFIDLMTNMLAYDPGSRLSMAEIIGHPWMVNGKTASEAQVFADFKEREVEITGEAAKEVAKTAAAPKNKIHRGLDSKIYYEQESDIPEEYLTNQGVEKI